MRKCKNSNQWLILFPFGEAHPACDSLLLWPFNVLNCGLISIPYSVGEVSCSMNPAIPGADFDKTTGRFGWTPAPGDDGDYSITFTATDDGSPQASDSETITVSVTPVSSNVAASNTVPNSGTGGGSSSSGCFIGSVIKDAVDGAPGF